VPDSLTECLWRGAPAGADSSEPARDLKKNCTCVAAVCGLCAAPNTQQIQEGVEWARQRLQEERGVYIHCAHGHGRSATVMAALLMSLGKAGTAEEAVALMRCGGVLVDGGWGLLLPGAAVLPPQPDEQCCAQAALAHWLCPTHMLGAGRRARVSGSTSHRLRRCGPGLRRRLAASTSLVRVHAWQLQMARTRHSDPAGLFAVCAGGANHTARIIAHLL
jgi:hypothetical protein